MKNFTPDIVIPAIPGLSQMATFHGQNFQAVERSVNEIYEEPAAEEESVVDEEEEEEEGMDEEEEEEEGMDEEDVLIGQERGMVVSAGADHTLLLRDNHMYGCGNNSMKQINRSNEESFFNFVEISKGFIEDEEEIISVRAGEEFSLALTEIGRVFIWGRNIRGVIREPRREIIRTPTLVEGLEGIEISRMECGYTHIVLLTTRGQVFTCGTNTENSLGNGRRNGLFYPERLNLPLVIQICAKAYRSAALGNNGRVYLWGENVNGIVQQNIQGRVVRIGLSNEKLLSVVEDPDGIFNLVIFDIQSRNTIVRNNIGEIVSISGGDNFYVFAIRDENGVRLESSGENEYGKLGSGNEENYTTEDNTSERVQLEENVEIISCGLNHCVAVTENYDIFAWGQGENGRLGTGEEEDEFEPIEIPQTFIDDV